jgi:hypothetical protein
VGLRELRIRELNDVIEKTLRRGTGVEHWYNGRSVLKLQMVLIYHLCKTSFQTVKQPDLQQTRNLHCAYELGMLILKRESHTDKSCKKQQSAALKEVQRNN